MDGIFITLEGPDGSGKTTALKAIFEELKTLTDKQIVSTREPGGSPIAEKIREIILDTAHTEMDARTEALLYAASRRQHLVERVLPVLEAGDIVLCDRFVDSSIAYQGYARGIGETGIFKINDFATDGVQPDLTLYIDVPAEVGLRRIQKGMGTREFNRLDQEKQSFHDKVRAGYLNIARENPTRIVTIDGTQTPEEVVADCMQIIKARFFGN
ncbi:dTMP kinase [Jeotgalibaca porci]|uniref:Thymidylate kinase n=1 Tax=Jeotgalibaca porci TaxID=1868793 RepID=A0A6G7WHI7_9LACT|nr:dTMP kinase [Jeotgalibaca porci]NLB98344.1 dTMP kinase [Lactobacillales bacterium]QIK51745.1 dTMP kinase [Jeotgalibaca porci]